MGGASAANSMPSSPLATGPVMLPPSSSAFEHGSASTSAANKRTSTTLKVSSRPTSMSTPSLAGSGGSHGNGMDFASQVGASLASLTLVDGTAFGNGIGEDTTVLGLSSEDADEMAADDLGNDTSRYSTFAVLDGEDGDAPSPPLMPGSPDMTVVAVADSTIVAADDAASDPSLEGMSLVGLPSAITPHAARVGGHLSNMYSHSESSLDTFRMLVGTSIEEEPPAGTAGSASAGGSNVSLSGRRLGGSSSSNGGADGEGLVRMSSAISLPNPDLEHGIGDEAETASLDGLDSGTSARRKMSWTISFGGGGSSSGKKK
ncbi:hypothetical protein BCR44DRAFT_1429181 [Catenaria anguillulae PL171]|uniref:Uncharacterized protein n=1 Tax=Catenaria anguillulae PL171 TaxID=765915 RepID=A0A1Y2HXC9_9FUNG|nr:hypothetical protein BCR44DRAFT_1429181 [Catenaria anguillulae PL171]